MAKKVLEVNVDDLFNGGVYALIRNFIAFNGSDMVIDIACLNEFENSDNVAFLESKGSHIHYIGCKGNKIVEKFVTIRKLSQLVRAEAYDCVHIHAADAILLFILSFASKRGGCRKIIVHSHQTGIEGNYRKLKYVLHIILRSLLKYTATGYAACSDLAAQWMFPKEDPENVTIINNGIDLERFCFNSEMRVKTRQALGIGEDTLLLGHVGRFCYPKNHPYLIEIFLAVKQAGIPAKLLLVGEGPDEQSIRDLVDENGLKEDVIFYGASRTVEELYNAMDIFLLPSHYEGLGIVGVESQAAGLPSLFSDRITRQLGLTPEALFLGIEDKDVCDWVQSIEKYRTHSRRDTYSEIEGAGFSIQHTVNQFLHLYE